MIGSQPRWTEMIAPIVAVLLVLLLGIWLVLHRVRAGEQRPPDLRPEFRPQLPGSVAGNQPIVR